MKLPPVTPRCLRSAQASPKSKWSLGSSPWPPPSQPQSVFPPSSSSVKLFHERPCHSKQKCGFHSWPTPSPHIRSVSKACMFFLCADDPVYPVMPPPQPPPSYPRLVTITFSGVSCLSCAPRKFTSYLTCRVVCSKSSLIFTLLAKVTMKMKSRFLTMAYKTVCS